MQQQGMENQSKEYMNITATMRSLNPLSANPKKWSNTLKQFVGNSPTNCLSVFDHFVILAFEGLNHYLDSNTSTSVTLRLLNQFYTS